MAVPLLNLKIQYENLKTEIDLAISKVIDSQHFILGKDVKEFEEEISNYLGVKHCLGVSSGTDALLMALMAIDIMPGDEVITTPYSFFATAGCIARLGAVPKFIDIDPVSFNLNPNQIEKAITKKTKAIMPVHLFGQSADMGMIVSLAKKYDLKIIEDAAQAIGSKYENRSVGSIGDIGCFSFFPSKNLGCFGDGGLVSTNNSDLYEKLLSIRNHGMITGKRYYHEYVGGNFRIDTIQAAVLRVKLPHLDNQIDLRRRNSELYRNLFESRLTKEQLSKNIILPTELKNAFHTYNQFVVRIPYQKEFIEAAKKSDIGVMVYYPLPLHLQPCFKFLNYQLGSLPESERASEVTVALPIYPEIPHSDIEQVVDLILTVGRSCGEL